MTGFLPRRKLYLRLCYGEASRRSQFPTVSVRPGETMSDDDLQLRNRPWQRFIESGTARVVRNHVRGGGDAFETCRSPYRGGSTLGLSAASEPRQCRGIREMGTSRPHSQHTSRSFFTARPATGSNLPSHAYTTRSNAHVMSFELRPNDFASLRAFASA
jgi:hypothetical protein